ncbi:TPA: hypothetical protein ACJ3HQ_002233, partial [Neisseria meningitidis]
RHLPNHSIHPNEFFDFCLNIIAGNRQRNTCIVIPAQAGIQTCRCGNLSGKTVSGDFSSWIPTFVGMTECRFVGMTWCRFPYGWIRHSRAGGNPIHSVSAVSDKSL